MFIETKDQFNIQRYYIDQVKSQTMSAEIALLEHPESILFCQFSDDCKYLATFCTDHILRIWQVNL